MKYLKVFWSMVVWILFLPDIKIYHVAFFLWILNVVNSYNSQVKFLWKQKWKCTFYVSVRGEPPTEAIIASGRFCARLQSSVFSLHRHQRTPLFARTLWPDPSFYGPEPNPSLLRRPVQSKAIQDPRSEIRRESELVRQLCLTLPWLIVCCFFYFFFCCYPF